METGTETDRQINWAILLEDLRRKAENAKINLHHHAATVAENGQ